MNIMNTNYCTPQNLKLKPNETLISCDYDDTTILDRKFRLPKTKYNNLYSTMLRYCTKYFPYIGSLNMFETKDYLMFKPKNEGYTISLFEDRIEITSAVSISSTIRFSHEQT